MGIYDTYGDCQIKAGDVDMNHYRIGAECPLVSGAYLTYEGIVFIKNNIVIAITGNDKIFDKYGDNVSLRTILDQQNSVVQAMKKAKQT